MEGIPLPAIALGVTILLAACGVVWRMSRVEVALRAEFYQQLLAAQEKVHAANEKIYKVEIWARDEFVRKGSFDTVVARMERSVESLGARIEGRLGDMAQRIEKIPHS